MKVKFINIHRKDVIALVETIQTRWSSVHNHASVSLRNGKLTLDGTRASLYREGGAALFKLLKELKRHPVAYVSDELLDWHSPLPQEEVYLRRAGQSHEIAMYCTKSGRKLTMAEIKYYHGVEWLLPCIIAIRDKTPHQQLSAAYTGDELSAARELNKHLVDGVPDYEPYPYAGTHKPSKAGGPTGFARNVKSKGARDRLNY